MTSSDPLACPGSPVRKHYRSRDDRAAYTSVNTSFHYCDPVLGNPREGGSTRKSTFPLPCLAIAPGYSAGEIEDYDPHANVERLPPAEKRPGAASHLVVITRERAPGNLAEPCALR